MSKTKFIIITAGFIFFSYSCKQNKTESNKNTSNISLADVMIARNGVFNEIISVTGSLIPDEKVVLHSEISGRVTGILFDEGSFTEKGKLLVKLNDNELQAQLKKLILLHKLYSDDELRKAELLKINAVRKEEYDIALNKLNTLNAEIELIEAQISKTEIYAPFSGIIGLRQISPGDYVSPQTPIAVIQNSSPIKIEFNMPEKFAGLIKKNTEIEFTSIAETEKFSAVIYALDAKIDDVTRTIKVRAIHPNKNNKLMPGSFVKINLPVKSKDTSVIVPSDAIVPDMKGNKVFVLNAGIIEEKFVKTGSRNETNTEIIDGISAGDTILVTGILQARKGNKLKILNIVR